MDLLQIALVLLILLLTAFLSVLGIQVFFILKDLKKSLEKMDVLLDEVEKPAHVVAEVTQAVENGVKVAKAATEVVRTAVAKTKPTKRLFKRK